MENTKIGTSCASSTDFSDVLDYRGGTNAQITTDRWHNQAHRSWKKVVNDDLDTALRKLYTTTNPANLIMNEKLRVPPGLVGDLLDDGFTLRRKHKKGYEDDSCEWVQD